MKDDLWVHMEESKIKIQIIKQITEGQETAELRGHEEAVHKHLPTRTHSKDPECGA